MFRATHRIRWKRDLEVEVLTNWSQDTGLCHSHTETRSAGQEEDVVWNQPDFGPTAQLALEEESRYYDQSWGRMICGADKGDFEVIAAY